MTHYIKAIVSAAVLLGTTACVSTNDIHVETVTDQKVNLKGYRTYQFLDGSGIVTSDDMSTKGTQEHQVAVMIEQIINEVLQSKGKVPTSHDPDLLVAYVAGENNDALKVKLDAKGKQIVEHRPEAALLILLVDAHSGAVLRLATAEAEAKHLPKEQMRKRLHYAIDQMLKDM
jgi:hypothetical protein